jgi:hypothetical protein
VELFYPFPSEDSGQRKACKKAEDRKTPERRKMEDGSRWKRGRWRKGLRLWRGRRFPIEIEQNKAQRSDL